MNTFLQSLTNDELIRIGWEQTDFEIELVKRLEGCLDELSFMEKNADLEEEEVNDQIWELQEEIDKLESNNEDLGCENVTLNNFILELKNKLQLLDADYEG